MALYRSVYYLFIIIKRTVIIYTTFTLVVLSYFQRQKAESTFIIRIELHFTLFAQQFRILCLFRHFCSNFT